MSLVDGKLPNREELLELLPEGWPGLARGLDMLERTCGDPLTIKAARHLLAAAAVELRNQDTAEKRAALIELLERAVVSRELHEARVTELLNANNREVERGRAARRFVKWVATMTDIEVEFTGSTEELRDKARALDEGRHPIWRPKYSSNERDRAASVLGQARRNGHSVEDCVDLVAEQLGLERA